MSDESAHELSVSRLIDASPAAVWQIWTERLPEWWAPRPWTTRLITLDLRPGGVFSSEMNGPAGERFTGEAVFLEVVPERRIVFTDAFRGGWIPQAPFMTAIFAFVEEGGATRYTASARHWSEEARRQHEEMGFLTGWAKAAEQLAGLAEGKG